MRAGWLRFLAVAVSVVLGSWSAGPQVAVGKDRVAFTIADPAVTQSSGLARDVRSGLYWTVNDSGSRALAYAVRPNGSVAGALRIRTSTEDVEAVAMFGDRLYVADIGDQRRRRSFITVYFFDNPRPAAAPVSYRSYDFSYPDGPHDAETLLVDPTGRLYIVTKERKAAIYAAPGQPSRQGVNRLIRLGPAPAFVTDGVFLPGGERIALRSYVAVRILTARSYRTVARAATPMQPQGESIAVTLDGKALLVGSEGARSPVFQIPVPTTLAKVPPAPAKPPGPAVRLTPTPSATPTHSASDDDEAASSDARRVGTVLALSLAGFVSVVAGVVVAAVRKH